MTSTLDTLPEPLKNKVMEYLLSSDCNKCTLISKRFYKTFHGYGGYRRFFNLNSVIFYKYVKRCMRATVYLNCIQRSERFRKGKRNRYGVTCTTPPPQTFQFKLISASSIPKKLSVMYTDDFSRCLKLFKSGYEVEELCFGGFKPRSKSNEKLYMKNASNFLELANKF